MSSDSKLPNFKDEKVLSEASKQGILEKQSRHLKLWKKRFFVLHKNVLYSFKIKDSKPHDVNNPTEIIDLRVFSSVKSSEDYTNRTHSFDVYSSDTVFSMVAASETEKEDWIRAIGRAIVITRTSSMDDGGYDEDDGNTKAEIKSKKG